MKQRIELAVEARTTGRAESRSLRVKKMVPGIIYGAIENANISLHVNDVLKYNARAYENALLSIKSSDPKLNGKIALIKDVYVHPLTRRPEHIDLFALDLTTGAIPPYGYSRVVSQYTCFVRQIYKISMYFRNIMGSCEDFLWS